MKKLLFMLVVVLVVSLVGLTPAYGAFEPISWDFETGYPHQFTLICGFVWSRCLR
jgi:hypothetical protein